ncbi:MAG: aldose 1-epimerase [Hallerella porci]|uniref:aldose 1-epimerase n=1 Tax=Hallerella TaxID=2815788 RepID=UPI001567A70E|nr:MULTISPECIES: aldose 1-epimerase [Hallerella]MCI5601703.1 aldose 1-epimerase [Hallerella sp.]MDY3920599.1 aldose 1-epimerase [Hallerella porci]
MHFSLESKPLGTVARYIIHADDCELEILAGHGAGLNAWRVPANGKMLSLLYGYEDAETFRKIQADTNAGAVLSPFPGRTNNAKWTWKNKTYQLVNNVSWAPHALHGFLNVLPWQLVSFSSDESVATLTLTCDFYGDAVGYPFTYKVTNKYIFRGNSFDVKSTITNTFHETIPYAEGFHPYFQLGKSIDELTLLLPTSKKALLDSADIPTGEYEMEKRFDGNSKLGETFINDYFAFDSDAADKETVSLIDSAEKKKIDVWQKTGNGLFRGIQIYTPPGRASIALEPMTSAPDVLNHHRELIEILPGHSTTLLWGAEFSALE